MNTNDIKQILEQLYEIDPGLRSREREITTLLRTLAVKPRAEYNAAFAAELRTRILAELAAHPLAPRERSSLAAWFFAPSHRWYSAAGLAAIAIAIIATTALISHPTGPAGHGPVALLSSSVSVTHVGDQAFGAIAQNGSAPSAASSATGAATASNETSDSSSGSGSAPATMAAPMRGMAIASPVAPPTGGGASSMPSYSYIGEAFSQDASSLDVLKKIPAPFNAAQAAAALQSAGFGTADLSTFSDLQMANLTLDEHHSFGYEISMDFNAGTVSIGQDYSMWPQETLAPLRAADIPSTSTVLQIAASFLADHHIATSSFGTPTVSRPSYFNPLPESPVKQGGGVASMPMVPYYPDSEQVVYPLVVNGSPVYDQSGNAIGMNIEVNVRYHRVASVYGLGAETYQASAYPAITDTSTILTMATQAVTYPILYNGTERNAVGTAVAPTSYLGTPFMAYMQTYHTDADGTNAEYLIPAFAFPVTDAHGTPQGRNVIVPLIQEFAPSPSNPPVIMPLGASAGSQIVP